MTWDLNTLIDFSGHPFECLKSLIDFFEPDLENFQYEVYQVRRDGWPKEGTLESGDLIWQSGTLSELEKLFEKYPLTADTYTYMSIGLGLYGYGDFDYSPYPEVHFCSIPQRRGITAMGQEGDAILTFGNHNAYKGENVLPKSGRSLDRDFVVEILKYLCQTIQPKNLYLLSEQQVYIPWNYHFIFHNTPQGYLQDLADVIQLVLHGGDERYTDGRHSYESGVSDDFGMDFCSRKHEHIKFLQEFILKHGTRLEQKGLPNTLTREDLEDSVLDACGLGSEENPLMDFFFVGEGLGVYSKPLLKRYCEYIFMALMYRFANNEIAEIAISAS
jgi:hypothetical protein